MAELDIQRKSGSNWLVWLLVLAVVALLAWWLIGLMGDDEAVVADGVVDPVATAPVAGAADLNTGPILDIAMLNGGMAAEMVGRQVALTSVPVLNVVSDRGFWIGDSEANNVFAIRTNESSPVTPPDGAVNQGQMVNVWGTVQQMPADLTQQATAWNLQSTDAAMLGQEQVYIAVDSVAIMQRP